MLIMKINFFLILVMCLQVSAKTLSQDISISVKEAPLEQVLANIKKQSSYHFFYDAQQLKTALPVTSVVEKTTLKKAMEAVMKDQPLTWYIDEEHKLVTIGRQTNIASVMAAPLVNGGINGIVIDEKNKPIPGATVSIKPFNKGMATNEEGKFNFPNLPPGEYQVTVTFIGYNTYKTNVRVSGAAITITVSLKPGLTELNASVIVGYGTTTKRVQTESMASIKSEELNQNHASASVSDMLAGRLPGLYSQKSGGAPGAGTTLFVRGLSTFNNSAPLVVIDGIPDRKLDDLNAADIETISVLKDASAISVYGARAANGVILVTTKKGSLGKSNIAFTANLINQRPTQYYKQMNSYQYASLYNEALKNENAYNPALGVGFSDDALQKFKDGSDPDHYPNTDWIDQVLSKSLWQKNYNLSVSGGSDKVRYYLSGSYVKNDGLVSVEGYKRYNLRSNLDARITRDLKVSLNLMGVFNNSNGEAVYGTEYVIRNIYGTPPIRVNQFSNGTYANVPEQRGNAYQQSTGKSGYYFNNGNVFTSVVNLQYDVPFIKGLSLKGNAAFDKIYTFAKRFATPYDMYSINAAGAYTKVAAYPTDPFLREYFTQSYSTTLEGGLAYDNRFGRHNLSGTLLYTQTNSKIDNFDTQRSGFISSSLSELGLGDPTRVTNGGTASQSARRGMVGRVSYNFDTRYLFQFNFRYDGSDIFPPDHRFGFFPSFSAGWVISDEPFMQGIADKISFLKLRASWGQLGNDRVSPYQFLTTYALSTTGGYTLGGASPVFYQTLQPNVLANPLFTWERANISNAGLELHLKRDVLTLEADYFYKRTKDILAPPAAQVPAVIGIGLPSTNDGIVDSKGIELNLTHRMKFGKFSYYVSPNVSFAKNKVIHYPESQSIPEWQKVSGKSIGYYTNTVGQNGLGYVSDGLYQSDADVAKGPTPLYPNVKAGDIRYKDIDGDGKITTADRVLIGADLFPKIQYGFSFGAKYEGLELNVLMQGAGNVKGYAYINLPASAQKLDRWTPDNPNAAFPRLWYNNQNNQQVSDYWLRNTAFLRLKNIELAYSLPANVLRPIHANLLRVFVSANNAFTFTHFKLFDPESAGQVRDPLMKSYTAGLTLQF